MLSRYVYFCRKSPETIRRITSRLGADPMLLTLQAYNAMRFGSAIAVAIILAKVSSQETIYTFETMLLVGSAFSFFFVSGLNNSLLPLYKTAQKSGELKKLFPSALIVLSAMSVVSVVLMNIYNYTANEAELRKITSVYTLYMLFHLVSMLTENMLLATGRFRTMLWWGASTYILYALIIFIPVYSSGNLESAVYMLVLFSMAKFAVTVVIVRTLDGLRFSWPAVYKILSYSGPVMFSLFIANIYVYLNSFYVKLKFSSEDFNIFRYGLREFPLFMILANSFSTVQSGILAGQYADHNLKAGLADHRKSLSRLMNQLFPVAILLMVFSAPLFGIAFNEDLKQAYLIFNILLFGIVSRILFPQSVLMGIHQTRYAIRASTAELLSGILLSLLLSYHFGLVGIAWAMVIAALIDKLVLVYYCKRHGINYFSYVPLARLLAFILLMILGFWIAL